MIGDLSTIHHTANAEIDALGARVNEACADNAPLSAVLAMIEEGERELLARFERAARAVCVDEPRAVRRAAKRDDANLAADIRRAARTMRDGAKRALKVNNDFIDLFADAIREPATPTADSEPLINQ